MIIAKVVGTVVTTIGHAHFKNRRLLVVQPLDGWQGRGRFCALDNTHAGIGDTVLVNREGGGTRLVLATRMPASSLSSSASSIPSTFSFLSKNSLPLAK